MGDAPHFLMTSPDHFDVVYQINPWMRPDIWRADPAGRDVAAQASAELRQAIEAIGGHVEIIDGIAGLPDLVFPANAAILLNGIALMARFRYPERQGEEAIFHKAFRSLQRRGAITQIVEFPPGVLQEGAGDCIWDADRHLFWAGHGQRSTHNAIPVIEKVFGQRVVALELATNGFYHLDTCFCPLADGALLYYPPAFTAAALATIHSHVDPGQRIEASDDEAAAFCVNAVNIGKRIVMAKPPASLRDRLGGHGFALTEIDLAPFILSGGGAYCMTLRLDRRTESSAVMDPETL